ncbi:MAG: acyl-CoA dehydrogenase family protein [Syntrophales bacterium]|nr:acyl-CoA dehydrogenase family protein [Syntrophales bacterium]
MDFKLTERDEMLQKTIREFAEKEIPPRMDTMEETGEFPMDLLKGLADMGILGVITPREYGGAGLGHLARILVLEQLGRVCPAMPMALQVHHMCTYALNTFGSEEQKKKYLPPLAQGEALGVVAVTEPSGGSDVAATKSTGRLEGDKYILNGRKCFITNAHVSNTWIVPVMTGEGRKGMSAFIVEKDFPGAKTGHIEDKVGLRGANTGELVFQDCEVPKENLIGGEGNGMAVALGTIGSCGRPGMASVGLGILNAVIEEAVKFATERELYGKPISNLQAIQWYITEIYSDLEIARLLAYRAGWMLDNNIPADAAATLAKQWICEAAARSARKAIEIHGSYGILKEYPIQRLMRDALVAVPAGGTAEIAKLVLSRIAIKQYQ